MAQGLRDCFGVDFRFGSLWYSQRCAHRGQQKGRPTATGSPPELLVDTNLTTPRLQCDGHKKQQTVLACEKSPNNPHPPGSRSKDKPVIGESRNMTKRRKRSHPQLVTGNHVSSQQEQLLDQKPFTKQTLPLGLYTATAMQQKQAANIHQLCCAPISASSLRSSIFRWLK